MLEFGVFVSKLDAVHVYSPRPWEAEAGGVLMPGQGQPVQPSTGGTGKMKRQRTPCWILLFFLQCFGEGGCVTRPWAPASRATLNCSQRAVPEAVPLSRC